MTTDKQSHGTQPPACGKISDERLRQLRVAVECVALDDAEARDLLAIIDAYRQPAAQADTSGEIESIIERLRAMRDSGVLPIESDSCQAIAGAVVYLSRLAAQPSASPAPVADERAEVGQTRDFLMHRKIWGCVEKGKTDCNCYVCVKFVAAIACFDRLAALSAQPSGALEREKCETCGGDGVIAWDDQHGEPRGTNCPDCAPPERAPGGDAMCATCGNYGMVCIVSSPAGSHWERCTKCDSYDKSPANAQLDMLVRASALLRRWRKYAMEVDPQLNGPDAQVFSETGALCFALDRPTPPQSETASAPSSGAIAPLRAALEKDAARYRWLRARDGVCFAFAHDIWRNGSDLDAAIDAALAKAKPNE